MNACVHVVVNIYIYICILCTHRYMYICTYHIISYHIISRAILYWLGQQSELLARSAALAKLTCTERSDKRVQCWLWGFRVGLRVWGSGFRVADSCAHKKAVRPYAYVVGLVLRLGVWHRQACVLSGVQAKVKVIELSVRSVRRHDSHAAKLARLQDQHPRMG